jgi:DNA-binding beta-propeller fold protein YncE
VSAAACLVVLGGCRSPVPFHGGPDRDAPVLGLGGAAPYVSVEPLRSRPPEASYPPLASGPGNAQQAAEPSPDVYANTRSGMLSRAVRGVPSRVYVPNAGGSTVDVIDPGTFRVVGHILVGARPQYVMPSWDLTTLWVNDSGGNALVPIDPLTARRGRAVPVSAPSNLYFTPNGRHALVLRQRPPRIDVRDPRSMRPHVSVRLPCGAAHADFAADGSYLVASCPASGFVIRVDLRHGKVTGALRPARRSAPQDVRISPDGTHFYVADLANGGVWTIDADRFRTTGFIRTGRGAHALIPSRDGTVLYVTNRDEGTISLIDFAVRGVVSQWRLPRGGSPDMGGVSDDGGVLWLSGRRHGVVYAISTRTGLLLRTIRVGQGPHGLCVFPQPGHHSLGHSYR